jgi:hypothetical protein
MRLFCRSWIVIAAWVALGVIASAQTATKPAPRPLPSRKYCQPQGGFCFRYPSTWEMLGEILGGNGVVVAPPQKQEREDWDEVTVALVVPAPKEDEAPVGLDRAIAQAVSRVRESGQDLETLQRQQRRVDDKPAELLKVRYGDKNTGQQWIEELVFIEGPESEIYSVALKCAPASLAHIEPQFSRILESWTLPEAMPVPSDVKPPNAVPPKS